LGDLKDLSKGAKNFLSNYFETDWIEKKIQPYEVKQKLPVEESPVVEDFRNRLVQLEQTF